MPEVSGVNTPCPFPIFFNITNRKRKHSDVLAFTDIGANNIKKTAKSWVVLARAKEKRPGLGSLFDTEAFRNAVWPVLSPSVGV